MSAPVLTIYRNLWIFYSLLAHCVTSMSVQRNYCLQPPLHISSPPLYILLPYFFFLFIIVCSLVRFNTGSMHHLEATGLHSLPTYQAIFEGRPGLSEYECLLYNCIIKNVLSLNHLRGPPFFPRLIFSQRNLTRQER